MNADPSKPKSAYFMVDEKPVARSTTLAVIVDNEPGVLARVVGLFSGRGYNIESLTVAETDHQRHTSRITVVTSGTPETVAACAESYTGQFLKDVLERDRARMGK